VHIKNHPSPLDSAPLDSAPLDSAPLDSARRLVCWAATADAPDVLLARIACLFVQITRSISVYQIDLV
jgi:hypothetical protein